jgi:hypothetical protein
MNIVKQRNTHGKEAPCLKVQIPTGKSVQIIPTGKSVQIQVGSNKRSKDSSVKRILGHSGCSLEC